MKHLTEAIFAGYAVLAGAIGINALAMAVGITTWYGYIEDSSIGVVDSLFLFAIYPILLGALAVLGTGCGRWTWTKFGSNTGG